MRRTKLLILAMVNMLTVSAASLVDVRPVNNKLLLLQWRAGDIQYHTWFTQQSGDVYTEDSLDLAVAYTPATYAITSPDDANYAAPQNAASVGRKTRVGGVADNWPTYNRLLVHWIYVELPQPMQQGKTYTIACPALTSTGPLQTFTFNYKQQRSEAVHVNQVGYVPDALRKFAYLYHFAGDHGPVDLAPWQGQPFHVIDDATAQIVFSGSVEYRSDGDGESFQGEPNYYGSAVWQCDFSAFTDPGTYRVALPGVGCSYPFVIEADVYREAFYTTVRGLFHQRSGPARGLPHTIHEKPVDHTPGVNGYKVYYSNFRVMNNTNQDTAFVQLPAQATSTLMPNAWGGWNDAADFDKYVDHLISSNYLCLVYEMAPDHFTDGELNLPESGNGIPDILDEAAWGVDFYLRLKGPTGGISYRLESYAHPFPCVAWTDTMTFYQSKEEPLASFWTAASAAQLAVCLQQAGFPAQAAVYEQEAIAIYDWAQNNLLPGDLQLANCQGRRAQAAAWLYKLTGDAAYQTQFIADNVVTNPNVFFSVNGQYDQEMAVWGFVTTNRPGMDQALKGMLTQACTQWAATMNGDPAQAQACRMGFYQWFPNVTGLGSTTPQVMPSIVAHYLTGDAQYLSVAQNAADYYLGGNPLNMCWVSGLGDRHPTSLAHLETWYDNIAEPVPGIVPYGMVGPQMIGMTGWWGSWATGYQASLTYPENWSHASHELWFDNRYCWLTNEFTVWQNIGPSAAIYAYLTGAQAGGMSADDQPSIAEAQGVLAYPSPSDQGFSLSAAGAAGPLTVSAFDALGHLVHAGPYTAPIGEQWTPGVYTLVVEGAGATQRLRVVKR